jgi:membrane-associated phospholipid phosphatase
VYLNLVDKQFPSQRHLFIAFTITFIATAISFVFFDQSLSEYFKFDAPRWLKVGSNTITSLGRAENYYFLTIVLWAISKVKSKSSTLWKERYHILTTSLFAMSFTSLVTILLKIAIGRMRPFLELGNDPRVFEPLGFDYMFHSIPSGHTTMVFCIYALLTYFSKKWAMFWLPMAVLIGLSRVVVQNHFLSDVFFGAFVGFYSTRYALNKYQVWLNKTRTKKS